MVKTKGKNMEVRKLAEMYGLGYGTLSGIFDRAEFAQFRQMSIRPKTVIWNDECKRRLEFIFQNRYKIAARLAQIKEEQKCKKKMTTELSCQK